MLHDSGRFECKWSTKSLKSRKKRRAEKRGRYKRIREDKKKKSKGREKSRWQRGQREGVEEWGRGRGRATTVSDTLPVMVVEVCWGWTPLQAGAYFLAETGISCWHCHFPSMVYSLCNTVSHLLF